MIWCLFGDALRAASSPLARSTTESHWPPWVSPPRCLRSSVISSAESRLRLGFEHPELPWGNLHSRANLLFALAVNAEPPEGFTLSRGEAQKDSPHRIGGCGSTAVLEVGSVFVWVVSTSLKRPNLAQNRHPHKRSDGLRVAKVAALDGLNYYRDRVPDLRVRGLRSQMMSDHKTDACVKNPS